MLKVTTDKCIKYLKSLLGDVDVGIGRGEEDFVVIFGTFEECQRDEGSKLIYNLVDSKKIYGLDVRRDKKRPIRNLDNNPDDRYAFRKEGKPKSYFAPVGFDGFVALDDEVKYVTVLGEKPISFLAIMFHELTECYEKVEYEVQYKYAHAVAKKLELVLIASRPDLTEGLAGVKLRRVRRKKND